MSCICKDLRSTSIPPRQPSRRIRTPHAQLELSSTLIKRREEEAKITVEEETTRSRNDAKTQPALPEITVNKQECTGKVLIELAKA
jgi:hypothetical protein